MYRGENQEQYIPYTKKRYLYASWGSSPTSVLKGFSLGILGHGMLLGYIKIINMKKK